MKSEIWYSSKDEVTSLIECWLKRVLENDDFLGIEELKEMKPDYKKKMSCYTITWQFHLKAA